MWSGPKEYIAYETIPHTNNYGRRLRGSPNASGKYTREGESTLRSLERAAGGVGFHVNVDKIEYISLNKKATYPH